MIREVIVTTLNEDDSVNIAPMGLTDHGTNFTLAPFRPSRTLDNLLRHGQGVVNASDDVRVFAGCLTGRHDWETRPAQRVQGRVLAGALAHVEFSVEHFEDDELRPRFSCRPVHAVTHAPFRGFNRAQAAVLEAAILVSRLQRLAPDKIRRELEYLAIAVDKTAGERERLAWQWLMDKVESELGPQGARRAAP